MNLKEAKKRQNVGINVKTQVQQFLDHGIAVTAGMIVGFDSDTPDIFERKSKSIEADAPGHAII